ncbi:hypothetical protein V8E51_015967 [Hyaloscypha variabilis]
MDASFLVVIMAIFSELVLPDVFLEIAGSEVGDWRSRHWFLKRCTSRPLHEIFSGFLDAWGCSSSALIGSRTIRVVL